MKRLTSEVTARAGWLRDCGLFAGLDDADLAAVGGKQAKITANGILKGDGAGGVSAAVKGTDYAGPSVGVTATLSASGWDAAAKTQTVSVAGVTATANCIITAAPDSYMAYAESDAVEQAWLTVYLNPQDYWDLYQLGEELTDLEDAFRLWRFRHVTTVERVIGFKRGTGGTGGVSYLRKMLDVVLFPEIWKLRTDL